MKVTLVMVQTVNGKITKGEDPQIESWTSREDKNFFFNLLSKYTLTIMGSTTYDAAKEGFTPSTKRRRIILTKTPDRYGSDVVPGQIEFTNENPAELVKRLEREGYKDVLLVGGGETNKRFFEENLVTDMYITVEPKLFGKGKAVVSDGGFEIDMKLESVKKLNEQGTLLLHYTILR